VRPPNRPTLAGLLGWNRTSYTLMSGFVALLGLIVYIWWPLVEEYTSTYDPSISFWAQFDWLLLGNFLAMSLLIMAHADLRRDIPIALVGLAGGLVIESWGTQTNLWRYYTLERPPLWIIPAWPIASLAIDRLFRLLKGLAAGIPGTFFDIAYWLVLPAFYLYMLVFTAPTAGLSLTRMALFLCAFLILTEKDKRGALLTFAAGSGLGYFLERWGTTRYCWVYYTLQTPPFFAVLAHGMAAVAFWRTVNVFWLFAQRFARGKLPAESAALPASPLPESEAA
jgi:hypothetical protein